MVENSKTGSGKPPAPGTAGRFSPPARVSGSASATINLQRSASPLTPDVALWIYIRNRTQAISFKSYQPVMDAVMCAKARSDTRDRANQKPLRLPFPGVEQYALLKTATEVFLMDSCGVDTDAGALVKELGKLPIGIAAAVDEEQIRLAPNAINQKVLDDLWNTYTVDAGEGVETIPYLQLIRLKLKEVPIKDAQSAADCFGLIEEKLTNPCMIELIWSYWHEEAMLAQTMNAISLRFQNKRRHAGRDPLAHLEIDPLRRLNNMLWGYVQDEQHRLSVERRAYEYDHHYGLTLVGKAVPPLKTSDSRSKFLGALHNLLHICSEFYKQDDDTTMVSDAFPVLNGVKETHLVLTQGAHNQYGDLPWTSRLEMLIEEWLLARPEIREFLPSRLMVAYPEAWMDRVEAMKKFQGWDDTPVLHFRDLGIFGEQILLSIRFHKWSDEVDPTVAKNWARYWRAEIQGYIHAYRVVTGVDLTLPKPDYTMPAVHLQRRLQQQVREVLPKEAARRLRRAP